PETITSVTPTPTAAPPSAIAEPSEAAPPPAADPRTVTYTVTGNRQLFDLITVIYTDQQGALQTDVNVALPWTKQVTLDPGVELSSVTATSVGGQLNCSITDGAGQTLVAQTNNTMIANCTR
ncbi:MAG: MmpS family transport accessory protein, partial [Mycobacterium sp.]